MKRIGLPFALKLILLGILIGILASLGELFIGHEYIIDPILEGTNHDTTLETYFAPTYYGLTISIIIAITFFFVYLFCRKSDIKPHVKAAMVGIIATIIFGIYYYLIFPPSEFFSATVSVITHFIFAALATFIIVKIFRFR